MTRNGKQCSGYHQTADVLGTVTIDIQHVGNSAIHHIKAKPVIDISVLVDNFEDVLKLSLALGFAC